jgi:hypothetical protein
MYKAATAARTDSITLFVPRVTSLVLKRTYMTSVGWLNTTDLEKIAMAKSNDIVHPILVHGYCSIEDCRTKKCETPCGKFVNYEWIGHGTHSGPGKIRDKDRKVIGLNKTKDFSGRPKAQNAVIYNESKDISPFEFIVDVDKTEKMSQWPEVVSKLPLPTAKKDSKD